MEICLTQNVFVRGLTWAVGRTPDIQWLKVTNGSIGGRMRRSPSSTARRYVKRALPRAKTGQLSRRSPVVKTSFYGKSDGLIEETIQTLNGDWYISRKYSSKLPGRPLAVKRLRRCATRLRRRSTRCLQSCIGSRTSRRPRESRRWRRARQRTGRCKLPTELRARAAGAASRI